MAADSTPNTSSTRSSSSEETARSLNEIVRELAFSDPTQALELSRRAYDLGIAAGDIEAQGMTLMNIGMCYFVLSDLAAAYEVWAQALELFRTNNFPIRQAQALNCLGNYYSRIGSTLAALDCYTSARVLYVEHNWQHGLGSVLTNIGLVLKVLGEFPRALEHYLQALEVMTVAGDDIGRMHTLNNIGNVYLDLGNYSQSLEAFMSSLALAEQHGNKRTEASTLNNIGNVQELRGDMALALEYYNRSLVLKQEIGDKLGEGNTLGNIGVIYRHTREFDKAKEYLQRSLELFKETGDRGSVSNALLNLAVLYRLNNELERAVETLKIVGEIESDLGNREGGVVVNLEMSETYMAMKRYDEAEALLLSTLPVAEEIQSKLHVSRTCRLLSVVLRSLGNFEKALEYYERFHIVERERFNVESDQRMQGMMVQLQMERTEKEREMYRSKAELLEQEVEFKRRELASHALHLVERNKLLGNIRRSLERLGADLKPENKEQVQEILRTIRGSDNPTSEWEVFSDKFQELHGEFMQTLSGLYSDLSPTELKICALTKIHLSTKEISAILHTSVRTIEAHRYRLRKKLSISADISLTSFLNSL